MRKCEDCGRQTRNATARRCVPCYKAARARVASETLLIRFWSKVRKNDRDDGCWEWTAARTQDGYGSFAAAGKVTYTHRFSWELHFGPIGDGLYVLHRCDNPPCVNPAHLFVGTHTDNMRDMVAKGRNPTECPWLRGENGPGAKLTNEVVARIRARVLAGETRIAIARELGLHRVTIERICRYEYWLLDAALKAQEGNR